MNKGYPHVDLKVLGDRESVLAVSLHVFFLIIYRVFWAVSEGGWRLLVQRVLKLHSPIYQVTRDP